MARMRQREIFRFLSEGTERKASDHYGGHEETIQGHIGQIHNEAGPIPACDCQICLYYHNTKTTGPEHTMTGCACWVCEKVRARIAKAKGYKYIPRSRRKMARKTRSSNGRR